MATPCQWLLGAVSPCPPLHLCSAKPLQTVRHTSCPDVLRSLPRVALQVADQRADRQSPQRVRVPFSG